MVHYVMLQVPRLVLAACCELTASGNLVAAAAVQTFPVLLVAHAVGHQTQLAATTYRSSSSSGGGSSNTSGSTLSAMFWAQIEQSGLLQQLPDALDCQPGVLQACPTAVQKSMAGMASDTMLISNLFNLLYGLQTLQPAFLTSHAEGRRCVFPAMQLGLRTLQFVSTAFKQVGRQEIMQELLTRSWDGASTVAAVALKALQSSAPETGGSAGSGSHGSSSPGSSAAALQLLQVQQTTEWVCLSVVMPMVAQFLQQATDMPNTPTSSSSRTTGLRGGAASSNRKAAAASATGKASSRQCSRQPVTNTVAGEQWLPAALAPSMPATYSSLLEQLGVGREVALWLATHINSRDRSSSLGEVWTHGLLVGMGDYNLLLQALNDYDVSHPLLAALHLSASAAYLQWLSSMASDKQLSLQGLDCVALCQIIVGSGHRARMLIEQQSSLQIVQQQDVQAQFTTANQAVGKLSTALLKELLGEWRSLPDSLRGAPSTGSSGDGGSSSSRTAIMLAKSCQHMVASIADAATAAATAEVQPVGNRSAAVLQLPFKHKLCCKLLQDCVRMAVPAAAAAAEGVHAPFSSLGRTTVAILGSIALLLKALRGGTTNDSLVAGGGDLSSHDDMQLFGLLCSLLKVYSIGSERFMPVATIFITNSCYRAETEDDISTAVVAVVTTMVNAALQAGYDSSSSNAGSRNCTAALPWLVLLGRCCFACAALTQYLQDNQGSGGTGFSSQDLLWLACREDLFKNLQLLRPSLDSVLEWLAAADTAQQLTALGYQPQGLRQQLAAAVEALPTLGSLRNSDLSAQRRYPGPEVLRDVQEQLQAAGRVLACFAIPHACNNPACSKLGESSEAQLVGGRTCICAGCLTARYCGRACQRAAWRQHKPVCKALAAAATAAATPTAAAVTGAKGGMAAAGPLSAGAEAADAAEAAVTLCAATAAVGGVSG